MKFISNKQGVVDKKLIFLIVGFLILAFAMGWFQTGSLFTATEKDGIEVDLLQDTNSYSKFRFKVDLDGYCGSSTWMRDTSFSYEFSTRRGTDGFSIPISEDLSKEYFEADSVQINGLVSVINRDSENQNEVFSTFENLKAYCRVDKPRLFCKFEGDIQSQEGADFCIKGDMLSIVTIYKEGYEPISTTNQIEEEVTIEEQEQEIQSEQTSQSQQEIGWIDKFYNWVDSIINTIKGWFL